MENLRIYEINPNYIDYLVPHEEHLFHNKKEVSAKSRKYIGIILTVNEMDYFVPLSSFKEKHKRLTENVDFIKIGTYAVININNMFPVPKSAYSLYDIFNERDIRYKDLLNSELKIIKAKQTKILENAKSVYAHKLKNGNNSKLGKRCNDFLNLERLCKEFDEKK